MLRADVIFGCTLDSVVDVVVCGESEFRSGAISGTKLIKKLECGFFEPWGNFQVPADSVGGTPSSWNVGTAHSAAGGQLYVTG
jgi:hypothetical protein